VSVYVGDDVWDKFRSGRAEENRRGQGVPTRAA
jgi:hypothetical protein